MQVAAERKGETEKIQEFLETEEGKIKTNRAGVELELKDV